MMPGLLIIEDEITYRDELARFFSSSGWRVDTAGSCAEASECLFRKELEPHVVLSDLNLPDGNALDLLQSSRDKNQVGEWVFLTAHGSTPEAVRAVKLGALDFLEKPCDIGRLSLVMAGAARSAKAQHLVEAHQLARADRYAVEQYAGRSAAAQNVREMLSRLAQIPLSALILGGETGTGKGLAARILHHTGLRAKAPMVEVNCAALPRELLEAELFGAEPGAYTGAKTRRRGLMEQANGGSLFLDEICELPLDLQAKILTAIEDGVIRRLGGEQSIRVDVQVMAASNRNLLDEVKAGRFRSDLYHRLNVFGLELPSLRERKEDIPDLVGAMIAAFNAKAGKRVRNVAPDVWRALEAYGWPGNVRELRNVVERCVLLSDGDQFPARWLHLPTTHHPLALNGESAPSSPEGQMLIPLDGSMALDDMDRYIIKTAMERCDHNVSAAARILGASRETIRYRVKKYGLSTGDVASD